MCFSSFLQTINKKCTENQAHNLIRFAATSTDVWKEKLLGQIKQNDSSIIRDFGMSLDMEYATRTVDVVDGVWRGKSQPFPFPESANNLAIFNANNRTRMNELQDSAGMVSRENLQRVLND